jgi:cytochrome c553
MPGTQPVAVASRSDGTFVVQIREPAQIVVVIDGIVFQTIALDAASAFDPGHDLFHHDASPTSAIACASCHPEGHDDGHTWDFDTEGLRRTQTVAGGVLATVPLHWNGDLKGMNDIVSEVFVHRMGGAAPDASHVQALARWIDAIPRYPASPTGTQAQIAHGAQLFGSTGCAACHSGAHFTNDQNVDVGTGAAGQTFQVPTLLGVAARAPYMHDGCAATLADRFDPAQAGCNGGEMHGHTAQLSSSDVGDLIAYLETL